jgi:multidrug efflux system outer membrane protein
MMVEDSLIAYRKTGEQRVSQHARVKAEQHVLRLAETCYGGGAAGCLEVLDAQRSLLTAEVDEVQAISGQLLSLIRIYKALGGGRPPMPEGAGGPVAGDQSPGESLESPANGGL